MREKIDSEKLKRYRRNRDLSQGELANMVGISRLTICKMESQGYSQISFDTLSDIAFALRVKVEDLLK